MKSYKDKILELKKQKKSILANDYYCIGLTNSNYRCSKTKNCHFLKNYYLGVSPKHNNIIELKEEMNISIDELEKIEQENNLIMSKFKFDDLKENKEFEIRKYNYDLSEFAQFRDIHNLDDKE